MIANFQAREVEMFYNSIYLLYLSELLSLGNLAPLPCGGLSLGAVY